MIQPDRSALVFAPFTLHKIHRSPTPQDINRYGGLPLGVTATSWPTIYNPETGQEQPMVHVLSVDPGMLGVAVPGRVGALALFASSTEQPLYFDDPTADYAVLAIDRAALRRGEQAPPVLSEPLLDAGVLELRPARTVSGRTFARGIPHPIQTASSDYDPADFVLQFTDDFLPLNLGDAGVLCMFTTWAFWESH